MNNEENKIHSISIHNRQNGTITGVIKILNSNSEIIILETSEGNLIINGKNLAITKFGNEDGNLLFNGIVNNIKYSSSSKNESFFKKLFK